MSQDWENKRNPVMSLAGVVGDYRNVTTHYLMTRAEEVAGKISRSP